MPCGQTERDHTILTGIICGQDMHACHVICIQFLSRLFTPTVDFSLFFYINRRRWRIYSVDEAGARLYFFQSAIISWQRDYIFHHTSLLNSYLYSNELMLKVMNIVQNMWLSLYYEFGFWVHLEDTYFNLQFNIYLSKYIRRKSGILMIYILYSSIVSFD